MCPQARLRHLLRGRTSHMGLPGLLRALIASVCLGKAGKDDRQQTQLCSAPMCRGSIMAQKVTQNQSEIPVLEKEDVTLNCVYEANSYTYYLFWYKQPPSGEMIFLIHQESFNELNTTKGQYFLNFQKATSSISLTITDLQLEDSAVYFCALRGSYTDGRQLSFGRGTSLTVIPKIKDPNPTVYQLRSPESSDTSVCLFTDFDSEVQLTQITGSKWNMMHKTNSTALDMEVLGSKSNGIVTWGNTSDAGCKDTFNKDIVVALNDGIACNAKLVEKSFETDMNLNSQNLSVIGFRILLLKVVGFNLLMTLRLWSS